jgi:Ca2+-binding RTX toxin-like protein
MQNAAWVSALINTLPDGTDKTLVINEDESYTFSSSDFGFADVDAGDSLSVVRIEHLPTAGSLKLSGLAVTVGQEIAAANIVNLTFTPAANANGTSYASFTFSVKDQYGAFDTTPNTLSLNVTAVNDSSILTTAQATLVYGTEDSSYTITQASLLTGFSDVDGNPLTVTGLTADNGTLSAFNATTQSWTFTPTANFNGTVNLSYNVTDGIANTAATQSFNLAAVNDAPTGNINVTGTRTQGQVLTADATSLADADDLGALSYQWQSSSDGSTWSNISGADSANYTVTATDVGQQVRLQTAYTDGSGNAELINSDAFSIGKLITGTSNNDRLIGTVNDDRIEGLAGYDIINGGTGADAMIGGLGNDGYYVDNIGDIVTENFNEGSDTVYSTVSYSLSANIETLNLIISSGAALSGNTIGNVINGNAGNDTLDGGAGNDYLYGNAGNDTYVFGRGYGSDYISEYDTTAGNIDTVEILSNLLPSDVVVNRYGDHLYLKITGTTEQLTLAKWFSSDAYKVEQIKFADGTIWDVATLMAKCNLGTAGNDQIAGTTGADTMQGGPGNDIYIINHNDDIIIENLNEGLDSVLASVSYTLGANIENLSLTSVIAGTLTGNALNNKLRGWYGDDTLDGGAGNDNLDGNVGNDTYVFGRGYGDDNINDYDSTIGNIDTIQMLSNLLPSDVVVSRDVNQLYLQINGTKDRLILTNWFISDAHKIEQIKFADGTIWDIATLTAKSNLGTTGNDYLAGTTGANTLAGGLGNDTYIVDHSGDVITEDLNEGIDRVEASISYTLSANVENLTLTSATAISGTGNELDNYIAGNFASNILDGGAGNDVLKGAGGLDRFVFSNLLGSNNVDTISDFSRGQDKIVLSNAIFTMLLNDTDLSDNIVVSVAGSNALDANDYLIYNSTTKALYYDADGSGAGAAVQFATLTNIATVRATDFVVM